MSRSIRKIVVLKDLSLHRIEKDDELEKIDKNLILFTLNIELENDKVVKVELRDLKGNTYTICAKEETPCEGAVHEYVIRYCLRCRNRQLM